VREADRRGLARLRGYPGLSDGGCCQCLSLVALPIRRRFATRPSSCRAAPIFRAGPRHRRGSAAGSRRPIAPSRGAIARRASSRARGRYPSFLRNASSWHARRTSQDCRRDAAATRPRDPRPEARLAVKRLRVHAEVIAEGSVGGRRRVARQTGVGRLVGQGHSRSGLPTARDYCGARSCHLAA
jgi:hypothetical protein